MKTAMTSGFITLLIALCATPAMGQTQGPEHGTAVLIDISGSMRFDGSWQADVKRNLNDLLFAGNLNETAWRVDGEAAFYEALKEGKPLYKIGEPLLVMHFGHISPDYPYFRKIELQQFADLNDARAFVDRNFPNRFTDLYTYTVLARAIARNKMLDEAKKRNWYIIQISDDDEDIPPRSASINPIADSLASAYVTTVNEPVRVSLTYKADRRLKMKIYEVTYTVAPNPDGDTDPTVVQPVMVPISLVEPANGSQVARVDENNPLRFVWRSSEGVKRYRLTLYGEDGTVVWRMASGRPRTPYTDRLKSGTYSWRVEGSRTQGGRAVSATWSFEVGGGGSGFLPVLLALLAGVGGYFLLMRLRRKRKTERL